jgi:hypothetical protein
LTDRLVERGDVELDVTEIDGRMLEIISKRYPDLRTHRPEFLLCRLETPRLMLSSSRTPGIGSPRRRPPRRSPACSGPEVGSAACGMTWCQQVTGNGRLCDSILP